MISLRVSSTIAIVAFALCPMQLVAIPPPPPAQTGSEVGTYNCGRQSAVVVMAWAYQQSPKRDYEVYLGGKPLSHADTTRLDREIEARGPFQAVSVYCVDGAPYELVFHRYTPTAEKLHVRFAGRAIREIR